MPLYKAQSLTRQKLCLALLIVSVVYLTCGLCKEKSSQFKEPKNALNDFKIGKSVNENYDYSQRAHDLKHEDERQKFTKNEQTNKGLPHQATRSSDTIQRNNRYLATNTTNSTNTTTTNINVTTGSQNSTKNATFPGSNQTTNNGNQTQNQSTNQTLPPPPAPVPTNNGSNSSADNFTQVPLNWTNNCPPGCAQCLANKTCIQCNPSTTKVGQNCTCNESLSISSTIFKGNHNQRASLNINLTNFRVNIRSSSNETLSVQSVPCRKLMAWFIDTAQIYNKMAQKMDQDIDDLACAYQAYQTQVKTPFTNFTQQYVNITVHNLTNDLIDAFQTEILTISLNRSILISDCVQPTNVPNTQNSQFFTLNPYLTIDTRFKCSPGCLSCGSSSQFRSLANSTTLPPPQSSPQSTQCSLCNPETILDYKTGQCLCKFQPRTFLEESDCDKANNTMKVIVDILNIKFSQFVKQNEDGTVKCNDVITLTDSENQAPLNQNNQNNSTNNNSNRQSNQSIMAQQQDQAAINIPKNLTCSIFQDQEIKYTYDWKTDEDHPYIESNLKLIINGLSQRLIRQISENRTILSLSPSSFRQDCSANQQIVMNNSIGFNNNNNNYTNNSNGFAIQIQKPVPYRIYLNQAIKNHTNNTKNNTNNNNTNTQDNNKTNGGDGSKKDLTTRCLNSSGCVACKSPLTPNCTICNPFTNKAWYNNKCYCQFSYKAFVEKSTCPNNTNANVSKVIIDTYNMRLVQKIERQQPDGYVKCNDLVQLANTQYDYSYGQGYLQKREIRFDPSVNCMLHHEINIGVVQDDETDREYRFKTYTTKIIIENLNSTLVKQIQMYQADLYLNMTTFDQQCEFSYNTENYQIYLPLNQAPQNNNDTKNETTNNTNTTTQKCPKDCNQCDDNGQCSQCNSGFSLSISKNKTACLEKCGLNTFFDFVQGYGVCSSCGIGCEICSSENECFKCKSDYFALNPMIDNMLISNLTCVKICPNRTSFSTISQQCIGCPSKCESCEADSQKCLRCSPFTLQRNGTCMDTIANQTQFIDFQGSIRNCSKNCLSCSQFPDKCLSCPQGQYLSNNTCWNLTKNSSCAIGQFLDNQTRSCQSCPPRCDSCKNANECTSCSWDTMPIYNYTNNNQTNKTIVNCSNGCYQGYGYDSSYQGCIQCSPNCSDCSYGSKICFKCKSGFFEFNGTCVEKCPPGKYGYLSSPYAFCVDCPDGCAECSSALNCSSCKPNYNRIVISTDRASSSAQLIRNTLDQGLTCVASNLSCPAGTYYNKTVKACVTCASGCALCNSTTGACSKPCSSNCSDCIIKADSCIRCNSTSKLNLNWDELNYHMKFQYDCLSNCPNGTFYNNITKMCDLCSSDCEQCTNNSACALCAPDFFATVWENSGDPLDIAQGETTCEQHCLQVGYFENKASRRCEKCQQGCLQCDGPDPTQCDKCNPLTIFNSSDKQCYCSFVHNVYPLLNEPDALLLDTFNLEWDFKVLNQTRPFNCSQIFNYTINQNSSAQFNNAGQNVTGNNNTNKIGNISFLPPKFVCQIQNIDDSYVVMNYKDSDYFYKQQTEIGISHVRIKIKNITKLDLDQINSNMLKISLNPQVFSQSCKPKNFENFSNSSMTNLYTIKFPNFNLDNRTNPTDGKNGTTNNGTNSTNTTNNNSGNSNNTNNTNNNNQTVNPNGTNSTKNNTNGTQNNTNSNNSTTATNNTNNTVRNLNPQIYLSSLRTTYLRCQSIVISATNNTNFTQGLKNPIWDIKILPINNNNQTNPQNFTDLQSALDQVVKSKYSNDYLNIMSNVTQLFTQQLTLNISLTATGDNNMTGTGNILVQIQGQQDALKFENSGTFTVNITQGITIRPIFSHYLCPNEAGQLFTKPASLDVTCTLFDNQMAMIKNLTGCKLSAIDQIRQGQMYYIKLTSTPSIIQGTISTLLAVVTETDASYCTFNGQDGFYSQSSIKTIQQFSSQDVNLNATTFSTLNTDIYVWSCESDHNDCPFQSMITRNPNYHLSSGQLTPGSSYSINMIIMSDSYIEKAICYVNVNIYAQIPMIIQLNSPNTFNYIDNTKKTVLSCVQDKQNQSAVSQDQIYGLNFKWQVYSSKNSTTNLLDTFNFDQLRAVGNVLQIMPGALVQNQNYRMGCLASNQHYFGNTSSNFTTIKPYNYNVSLTVSPTIGFAFSTNFTFTATINSSANSTLDCTFGYLDSSKNQYVNLGSQNKTQLNQTFVTQLPSVTQSSQGILTLFTQCIDLNKITSIFTANVTIKNGTYDRNDEILLNYTFVKFIANPNINNQSNSTNQSAQGQTNNFTIPQIILTSKRIQQFYMNYSNSTIIAGYLKICDSINALNASSFTLTDIDQLVFVMGDISRDVVTKKLYMNNTDLLIAVASALDKILFGSNRNMAISSTTSLDVDLNVPTTFKVMEISTFKILGNAVDQILEVTLLIPSLNVTSQNLIKGLQVAGTRIAGNMEPSMNSLTINGTNFAMTVTKISQSQLTNNGVSIAIPTINQTSGLTSNQSQSIKLNISSDGVFSKYDNLVIKALVTNSTLQPSTGKSSSRFASDIIIISAESPDGDYAYGDTYTMTSVEVKNLSTPFTFSVPLAAEFQNNLDTSQVQKCVYYNEQVRAWVQNECQAAQNSSDTGSIICCSYHMTQFSVQSFSVDNTKTSDGDQKTKILKYLIGFMAAALAILASFGVYWILRKKRQMMKITVQDKYKVDNYDDNSKQNDYDNQVEKDDYSMVNLKHHNETSISVI